MKKDVIQLETSLTIEDALDALRQHTVSNYFKLKTESLVGTVSKNKILLYRGILFHSNSFLPVFEGKFEEANGKVVLNGKWKLHWFVKISSVIFLFITCILIANSKFSNSNILFLILVCFAIWFIYKIGIKMGNKDKDWILYQLKSILKAS
ncbi:hypothetical protein [Sulfurimonas sp.]